MLETENKSCLKTKEKCENDACHGDYINILNLKITKQKSQNLLELNRRFQLTIKKGVCKLRGD